MTTVNVKLSNTIVSLPAGWNQTATNPVSLTNLFTNMLDSSGATTGLALDITTVFAGKTGSSTWAASDYHGLPMEYWRSAWYASTGVLRISGFTAGQTGNITVAGHRGGTGRNTNYSANGGSNVLYTAAVLPAAPVVVPFTADGSGYVTLSSAVITDFSYINGFVIDYTVASGATIDTIDALYSGQSASLTITPTSYAATSLSISDGAITKNVTLSGASGSFSFTAPSVSDGQTMLRSGTVSVVATDGSDPTSGESTAYTIRSVQPDDATLRNFSSVTLTDVSDPDTIGVSWGLDPLPAAGWDVVFDGTRGWSVDQYGIATNSSSFTGTSIFYLRDLSGVCATINVITVDGVVPSTGGLTSSGLTSSGLTRAGLTSAGL